MAKCLFCDRKSLFLRVNAEGYCKDCVPCVAARKREEAERIRKEEAQRIASLKAEEDKRLAQELYRKSHDEFGHNMNDYFTFVPLRVAGVTYKNGRRSRQTILRNIYFKDDPYSQVDKDNCIDFVATNFEGDKAVEIWVFNKKTREQIGYVPRNEASFFFNNLPRLHSCFDFTISGGGKNVEGDQISWGAGFTARFFNLPGQGKVDSASFSAFELMKRLDSSDAKADGLSIAYSFFKKKFPHASIYGCVSDPNDANKLIINVGGDKNVVAIYNPSSNSVTIDC